MAEGKKAKTGLHEGDALPELPVLHDEADNPVQLTVVCLASCWSVFPVIVYLMCAVVDRMFSSAGAQEVVKGSGLVIFFFPKQGTGKKLIARLSQACVR